MRGEIDKALEGKGVRLRGFRSGGGLRVVRVEQAQGKGEAKLLGYGEHYDAERALKHCAEDLAAGGRPYEEVYGKKHTHYLTGSASASGPLDAWLLEGGTIDAWCVLARGSQEKEVVVELKSLDHMVVKGEMVFGEMLKTGHGRDFRAALRSAVDGPEMFVAEVAEKDGGPEFSGL